MITRLSSGPGGCTPVQMPCRSFGEVGIVEFGLHQASRPATPAPRQSTISRPATPTGRNASYNFDGQWWAADHPPRCNFTVVRPAWPRGADDLAADDTFEFFMMSPVGRSCWPSTSSRRALSLLSDDVRSLSFCSALLLLSVGWLSVVTRSHAASSDISQPYTTTGWAKKVNPKCSTHNFVKYWPILKILSPLQSPQNLQRSGH